MSIMKGIFYEGQIASSLLHYNFCSNKGEFNKMRRKSPKVIGATFHIDFCCHDYTLTLGKKQ